MGTHLPNLRTTAISKSLSQIFKTQRCKLSSFELTGTEYYVHNGRLLCPNHP